MSPHNNWLQRLATVLSLLTTNNTFLPLTRYLAPPSLP